MDRGSVSREPQNLPAELTGPTPRRVRMTGTGWLNLIAAMLFFGLGVAGAAAIAIHVHHDVATQQALRQQGIESSGRITEVWTRRSAPHIRYSFPIGGISYSGESEVKSEHSGSLRRDDPILIRYLPANPGTNRPAGWEDSPYSALWIMCLPAALAFMGLMFVRRFPVQRRLAVEGIAVRGSVAKSEWNGPSKNQRHASYTFRNASNDEVEIGSCPSDDIYKADSAVWVLYLPGNPRRSEIYPFPIGFFRVES